MFSPQGYRLNVPAAGSTSAAAVFWVFLCYENRVPRRNVAHGGTLWRIDTF